MSLFNTDAIVLKHFDLGEADKIITFYTKDKGKVRAVARGARKTKSSISGLLLPFTYNNITFYRGRSLDRINKIKNRFSFSPLREDLNKMAYASYMAEIIEKAGMEDDPNRDLFSLLLTTFHQLLKADEGELNYINLVYKVRFLGIMGFKPRLDNCINCNRELKTRPENNFSIEDGGFFCSSCKPQPGKELFSISGEALEILKKLFQSGLEPVKNLRISKKASGELDKLIDIFIIYHLDLKLKSLDFLNMIRDLG